MDEKNEPKSKWIKAEKTPSIGGLRTSTEVSSPIVFTPQFDNTEEKIDSFNKKQGDIADMEKVKMKMSLEKSLPVGRKYINEDLKIVESGDLSFKKVRGRRELMDMIVSYVQKNKEIEYHKLTAYFQYVTGASQMLINQCVAVLENLEMIKHKEIPVDNSQSKDVYYV